MVAEERRSRLLEVIRLQGFASLPDLAGALQVSESTVRRDLSQLEQEGAARRTHGGAFYTGPSPSLPHFDRRQAEQWVEKRRIAEVAAALIDDGDTILLDGGSTTYELARLLVGRSLQVVTNSLPIANLFLSDPNTDVIMLGGYVHGRSGAIHGRYTDEMLRTLNVRRAVLSAAGVTERGVFNSNLLLVETEQAMMQAADEVILVADSTKYGHQSLSLVCPLSEISTFVVDDGLASDWRVAIESAGARLVIATTAK
jgi:DeoR/GlpR family transcriptional regulator of sugar metabolism